MTNPARRRRNEARDRLTTLAEKMMNKTPRTRLVTLMAEAAGVTAAVGFSISTPEQALASTARSATIAADTVKNKLATEKKTAPGAQAGKAKSATADKSAAAKKPAVSPKSVVSTAAPNAALENDVNGDGSGY